MQFTVYPDKPGTYSVDINGAVTSFTVAGEQQGTAAPAMVIVILLIMILIPAVLLFLAIIYRRLRTH